MENVLSNKVVHKLCWRKFFESEKESNNFGAVENFISNKLV